MNDACDKDTWGSTWGPAESTGDGYSCTMDTINVAGVTGPDIVADVTVRDADVYFGARCPERNELGGQPLRGAFGSPRL